MRWSAFLPLVLVACAGETMQVDLSGGGLEPGVNARVCEQYSVERVVDLQAPLDGYGDSPEGLLRWTAGEFNGAVFLEELPMEGALHLDERVGEVRLFTSRWSDDMKLCDTWIELELSARLQVEYGLLDEVFSAVVRVAPGAQPSFSMNIPQDQIRGLLQGEASADGPLWLTVEASLDEGWEGTLSWWVDAYGEPIERLTGSFSFEDA